MKNCAIKWKLKDFFGHNHAQHYDVADNSDQYTAHHLCTRNV